MKLQDIKKVLVVVAHPDDDVLGCGGTIAKLSSLEADVQVVFLGDGVSSRYESDTPSLWKSELEIRKNSAVKALMILGVKSDPIFFDLPDNQLDAIPLLTIAKKIESVLNGYKPDLVLTHFPGDLNVDHSLVARATLTAVRPGCQQKTPDVWHFEVPSSTEWSINANGEHFVPNLFIDIKDFLSNKIAALSAYDFEMRKFPHPRSEEAITALATWRGSNSGLLAAESFIVSRLIG